MVGVADRNMRTVEQVGSKDTAPQGTGWGTDSGSDTRIVVGSMLGGVVKGKGRRDGDGREAVGEWGGVGERGGAGVWVGVLLGEGLIGLSSVAPCTRGMATMGCC